MAMPTCYMGHDPSGVPRVFKQSISEGNKQVPTEQSKAASPARLQTHVCLQPHASPFLLVEQNALFNPETSMLI